MKVTAVSTDSRITMKKRKKYSNSNTGAWFGIYKSDMDDCVAV
jgi:hypothetical protein